MKGIILAGGSGTRMYPATKSISKHLLCVYDKPLLYYPLSTLLHAGIKDILIISTEENLGNYKKLFGSGHDLGIKISYEIQNKPGGIAEAFLIAKNFVGSESVCLILGDNIFYGKSFNIFLKKSVKKFNESKKAHIFGYYVENPSKYGVMDFDINKNPITIIEKPINPASNCAVVGLYFYPSSIFDIVKKIKPSKRGELEITCVNNYYLEQDSLNIEILDKDFMWIDAGTPDSLLDASNFIKNIEKKNGIKVACLEEISYRLGYINKSHLNSLIKNMPNNEYVNHIEKLIN